MCTLHLLRDVYIIQWWYTEGGYTEEGYTEGGVSIEGCVHLYRGGYCFEQNALMAAALRAAGYDLYTSAARVVAAQPDDPDQVQMYPSPLNCCWLLSVCRWVMGQAAYHVNPKVWFASHHCPCWSS